MTVGDSRELGGPQLRYSRRDDAPLQDCLTQALELARRIEELLEETRSVAGSLDHAPPSTPSTHSTRMARAMAASLVDELEVLARPARSSSGAA